MRGTNAACAAPLHVVPREVEMAARDSFGPLTRRAFDEAPISILASHTLAELSPHSLNLQDPAIDRALADGVRRLCLDILLLDRERQDAELGLRPLVPRRRHR